MRNENPLAELADTGHRGQKSAEPMSGLNPDAIDEGAIISNETDEERTCLLGGGAGRSPIDRVFGLSIDRKGEPENPEI